MTEQQLLEINAFLDKEDNITKLAKRGYNGETLTGYEIALLENAKSNINEIMKIYDLDSELDKRLNKLLLYIINVKQLDEVTRNKEVKAESTLSIAIKKDIKEKETKELALNSKWYLNKDLILTPAEYSKLSSLEYDIIENKTNCNNIINIFNKLGGLNRTVLMIALLVSYALLCIIMNKIFLVDNNPVVPMFTLMKELTKCFIGLTFIINITQLIMDMTYIMLPNSRELFKLGDKDLSKVKTLISPEARLTPIIQYRINTLTKE